uniref:Uncharacterized protein n=1 Tax=Corethron hystrix TaxID=216773 RepID=A0A7S1BC78_9STRA|mmetsp:Transcript_21517/g.48885  ORF Transcript_21517/g.48885 Transcript_21517/m.48885 type:complete len:677 (+) Transcript_21517:226-2256(+)
MSSPSPLSSRSAPVSPALELCLHHLLTTGILVGNDSLLSSLASVSVGWGHCIASLLLDTEAATCVGLLPTLVWSCLKREAACEDGEKSTFCLAWFDAGGIVPAGRILEETRITSPSSQSLRVQLGPTSSTMGGTEDVGRCCSVQNSMQDFVEMLSGQSGKVNDGIVDEDDELEDDDVTGGPVGEWRGIGHRWSARHLGGRRGGGGGFDHTSAAVLDDAIDEIARIFVPFGYQVWFLRHVLLQLAETLSFSSSLPPSPFTSPNISMNTDSDTAPQSPFISSSPVSLDHGIDMTARPSHKKSNNISRLVSLAVRGATVALPDGAKSCVSYTDATTRSDFFPRIVRTMAGKRAVQFLNMIGDRAVRLRTPPLSCGPIAQPITIFVVAIALVDGCILSGLRRRFEIGHMYPDNSRNALIDMSSICVSAWQKEALTTLLVTKPARNLAQTAKVGLDGSNKISDDQLIDKGTVSDSETEAGSGYSSSSSASSTMSAPPEKLICRGTTGPGDWHCYVVTFDGEKTSIRVDARPETTHMSYCNDGCGNGVLDGLTIGADHRFDFPLCDGTALEGEGEGTIAEVVVFGGDQHMDKSNIISLERHLMKKHGIAPATDLSPSENEWRRQAHALIVQPYPWKLKGAPLPLRIAAQHHSVAWHRSNKVTGEVLHVPRIGSKLGTGSSDW